MKIIHLATSYDSQGGVESHVRALVELMTADGHQVEVVTRRDLINQSQIDQVGVVNWVEKINYKLTLWRAVLKLARKLMAADVIHVHDVYWWILPLYPLVGWKTFITFHGWEGQHPIRWQVKLARWIWSQLAVKTIHVGAWIQEFYWDQPDWITYGGCSVQLSTTTRASHQNLNNIVFVGRLVAENDLELYLQLVRRLKKINPRLTVTWVGDGPYRQRCHQFGRVTGMVADPDRYLPAADLVWASSYLSILEAQAAGKIVAAVYSHRLKKRYLETCPGSALMLINDDVDRLAEQIQQLGKNHQLLNRYQQLAGSWARTQTWQKVKQGYYRLWGWPVAREGGD